MTLIYRVILLAVMYLAAAWLVLRCVFPNLYLRLLRWWFELEARIENADIRPFLRAFDRASEFALALLVAAFAWLVLAGLSDISLHLAR